MSFSIQTFIKDNCNGIYNAKTLNKLAEKASEESNGRYTIKNTHKFLCRYAYVKNGNILLDYNKRIPEQTIDNILDMVNETKNNKCKPINNGFGNLSKVNIIEPELAIPVRCGFGNLSKVNLTQPDSPKQVRSGFGNLSKVDLTQPKTYPILNKNCSTIINISQHLEDDNISTSEIQRRTKIYEKLSSQYYPPQRSEEWFKARETMITASNGGTLLELNPYEHDFQYIFNMVFGKPFETNEACYHGKKYEQIATMIYEQINDVKVKEFGLCAHPKYKFLGASPDGIVSKYKLNLRNNKKWNEIEKEIEQIHSETEKCEYIDAYGIKTKLVGRMLEIKCPNRRRIKLNLDEPITDLVLGSKKGICPSYYWCQVQLQLNCCELDECDFWQCEIIEYADRNDYINDTNATNKGVVIQLMPIEHINNEDYKNRIYNYASFIYPPQIDMNMQELDQWILSTMDKLHETHKNFVCESIKYWYLRTSRNVTIMRDDKWFNNNINKLSKAWDTIEFLRTHNDIALLLKNYIATFPINSYGQIIDKNKKISGAITALMTNPTDKKIIKIINTAIKK